MKQPPYWFLLSLLVATMAGCETFDGLGKTKKYKNPVVGPPPRRMAVAQNSDSGMVVGAIHADDQQASRPNHPAGKQGGSEGSKAGVNAKPREQLAGTGQPGWRRLEQGQGEPSAGPVSQARFNSVTPQTLEPVSEGEVAALVNGEPVFSEHVVEAYSASLAKAQKQIPEAEFEAFRKELVQKHLKPHIERTLLLQAMRTKFKEEQLEGMSKHLDHLFEEEAKKMMKDLKLSTMEELDRELHKGGSSLKSQKTAFKNQRMAQEYVMMKSVPKTGFDRPDMLEYYQTHLEEFTVTGQVKWQQIVIKHNDYGGRAAANQVAHEVAEKLVQGEDFATLARKYSSGATAKHGGYWDWTKEGSLASPKLEQALWELPVGEPSAPIEVEGGFEFVRVLERQPSGRKSFESVQSEIKQKLREAEYRKAASELIDRLFAQAEIQILIDK